jgi:hypothetical protein
MFTEDEAKDNSCFIHYYFRNPIGYELMVILVELLFEIITSRSSVLGPVQGVQL